MPEVTPKKNEFISKLKEFLLENYEKNIISAVVEEKAVVIDFHLLDKKYKELGDMLLNEPKEFLEIVEEVSLDLQNVKELPKPVKIRFFNLPASEIIDIRDLRSKHIGRFICTEGIVRKGSEIRPEIVETVWKCPECEEKITQPVFYNYVSRPLSCECGNRKGFKQIDKKLIDARWVVIEEPFELTEGERPSQVTILLTEDLVSPEGRRMTDPGNRLKITGILRDIPKGKTYSTKLDFYLEADHVEPTEIGWEKIKITKEDEKEIKKIAKDPKVYEKLIGSLATSLYGLSEIKESIILQLFGGVPKILKDRTRFRGEIHLLLIGDPASGKTQLMKLVPQIVPRGKYVSGKGATAAGLTASVSKDEQFMGGWVLEAGAMVLANKGLLSIDEFEKMAVEDQVAMHEAMESGTISIAKASIVATLPAQTSVLAGGNPKFSRFDPYMAIARQINIPDTLLGRFDLKFVLRDIPDKETDKRIVEHILKSREDDYEGIAPKLEPEFIRKYIAYTKENCKPVHTKETGMLLKKFYLDTRKKAEVGGAIPMTLRQFEGLLRLSEASAKIQLSNIVRKKDVIRVIRLMKHSLQQLGYDQETGVIDVDRSEGITSSSERSNIRIVLDIIETLSKKKKEIPIGEIEEEAKKDNVKNVDEIIDKLKKEGMLFEPSPGFVQKV